jgi:hypothetical protein
MPARRLAAGFGALQESSIIVDWATSVPAQHIRALRLPEASTVIDRFIAPELKASGKASSCSVTR